MTRLGNRFVLLVVGVLATLAVVIPATAAAAPPTIVLKNKTPEGALLGTRQTVTLVAEDPETQPRGYNLTFRVVLPAGVEYKGGAAPTTTIANKPLTGQTTLIFENVSDLSPKSSYTLAFEVEPKAETFKTVGTEYPIVAESFISEKPRRKPVFEKSGAKEGQWAETPTEVEKIGRVKANSTTKLTAIEILKSEPSPEQELLRGVHEHQTVYTLTVKNNNVKPTKEISVEDFLPAGLEYLACDEADNTENAVGTNKGSKEEYPGAGAINAAGNVPATTNCLKPTEVETVEVDPPGPQPFGVYTHVTWKGLGELAVGGERKLQYIAAVPIRSNAPFPEGTAPSALSLEQAANLDNNTGPETYDEEALTNVAQANGVFVGGPKAAEQTPVSDTDEITRYAEDLAVQKSVDKPGIADGQISTWTMKIESSEYRYVNNVRVDDTLPNGLCPLGTVNYEKPIQLLAECNPVKGQEPSAEYTNVEEQKNGGFEIHWDQTTDPQLAQMPPSTTVEIKFPTRNRVFYQENFETQTSRPILTKDSWKNEVEIAGANYARCAPNDPTCTKGQPEIFHQEEKGADIFDTSFATQEAGGIEIQKTVRKNLEEAPGECKDESGHYVKGLPTAEPALPKYRPGDQICWRLRVEFSSNVYAGTPTVSDFIPTDEEFVPGSVVVGPSNNVGSTFKNEEEVLEWTLGEGSVETNKLFEARLRTKVNATTTNNPGEISGNLMKVSYSNKEGVTFPLRDRAEVERQEPNLELKKKVLAVNGGAASTTVKGGDKVKFGIELPNTTGTLKAEEIEVWDELPTGLECGVNVTEISNEGECVGTKRIVWKPAKENISVEAGKTGGPLTYVATIPSDVAPGHKYENTAGVVNFKSKTNTGGQFTYIPENNINPLAGTPNTGPAKATASVTTSGATVTKTATTETTQEGNSASQATIGETVKYTVTAKVPKNSVLYETATLKDEIPAGLELLAPKGQATLKLGSEESPVGFTVTEVKEGEKVSLQVNFPETFTTGATESEVVLTFKARVRNIAANVQGTTIENKAKLAFHDKEKASRSAETKEATKTPVVEPELKVTKVQSIEPSEIVKPGEAITYTVGAEDATGHSAANNVVLVDNVPAGMRVIPGETEGGVYESGTRTLTWTIGTVNPGQKITRQYKLEIENPANAASVFNNTVTGTTQSMPPGEGAPGRTATFKEGTYEAAKKGYESSASRSSHLVGTEIVKTVEPTEGTIGSPLKYTLSLKLLPGINYYNTTIVDTLPDGVAYDRTIATRITEEGGEEVKNAATKLTEEPEGTPQRFGWYFGTRPSPGKASSTAVRHLIVEFEGHVKATNGGGAIKKGAKLTNSAVGLYNGSEGSEPKGVPDPTVNHGGFSEATTPATATTTVNEPELTIAKSVKVKEAGGGQGPEVQAGSTFTYKLVVTNSSEWAAHSVEVTDTNPQADLRNLTPINLPAGAKVLSTAPLRWEIVTVAKGAPVTLEYTAELAPSNELTNSDKIDNTAKIPSYYGIAKEEQKPKVEYVRYVGNESSVHLQVALPQLVLTKTAGPNEKPTAGALIGEPFQWNLRVENASAKATAKGVAVRDTLPAGWKYVEGSAELKSTHEKLKPTAAHTEPGEEEELLWTNVADLGPEGTVTLIFKAIPTTELVKQEATFTNHAVTTGEDVSGKLGSLKGPYKSESSAQATLQTPPLKIEKTPDEGEPGAQAIAGGKSAYKIVITNEGEASATEVQVSDLLDEGNVYTPGPGTGATANTAGFSEVGSPKSVTVGSETKTEVTWAITEIPKGGVVTITVPVGIEAKVKDGAKLHDVASVVSRQQPVAETDKGTLEISREADLGIVKTQLDPTPPAKAVPGESVEYNLRVENHGPSNALAVEVSDLIPAGTALESTESPCAPVGTEVHCEIGEMAAGESKDYKVKLKVLSATTATVVNSATVITSTEEPKGGGEPNKSTVETEVEPIDNLTVVKKGPAQPVLLGSTFEYELEVANSGPSDAVGVVVTDELPEQEQLVSAQAPCEEGEPGEVECALGTLVAGAPPVKLHFTVKTIGIPAGGTPVVNHARASSTTSETTSHEGTAETQVLPAADLSIVKTAPATVEPNGELTYKIQVENHGPSIAHKVTVTDPLPAGVVFVSASEGCGAVAGTVTCTVQPAGELAIGAAADFQVTVHVPYALGGLPLVNTATVAAEEADPNTENDASTVTTTVGPAADLAITKTMGKAEAGKPLTYTLAVTDKGPSASSAATVKDTLPAGTAFKSAAPSQGTCSAVGQEVTCALGALAAGASAQVSITVEVAATVTGTLRNTARVEGPEPDPEKGNNESTVEGPVTPAAPTTPNLKVVKTASTSAPQVGTPFTYDVAVSNMGGAEAKNVKVLDTLNGPVKVLSIESEAGRCEASGSKISCTIPSVAVGKTVHITYSVVAEAAGPLSNTASAQASNGEKAPANNHAVKSVKAKAAKASFTLTKTAAKKVVEGGKKVAFTITLRNGPTALVDAKICDRLPAALVFVRAAGASFVKGEACWQKKYVAAHRTLKLHLTARAVRGFKPRKARNVASASAENAPGAKHASATVRIKPAFAGAPGGVTG